MERLKLAVPTLFGLEGLAADELRRLGLEEVRADNGRVRRWVRPADVARLNLNLRTGERVLLELGCLLRRGLRRPLRGDPGPALGAVHPPERGLPGQGPQPELRPPLRPRLPVHREKGGGRPAGTEHTAWRPCRKTVRSIRFSFPS